MSVIALSDAAALDRVRGLDLAVPALDLLWFARARPDVSRRRTNQASGLLLLEDVGAPPSGAGTGEHRGEHVSWNVGEVEHDGRPELDVGGEHSVGLAFGQNPQCRPLELLGDLKARST